MADLTQDPASIDAPDGAAEGYRPLSLLALVGFLLALLFVACVLVGGLSAFGARHPRWLVVWLAVSLAGGWLAAVALGRPVLGTVGLALAGVTTLVGLFGLVTCSATSPWLLPWPVWLLVGVALLTCWLASSRIAASEGTLGGETLTRWGIGLTLFFTLNYGAYYLSSVYAVRSQARECTDEYLDLLREGKILEAFTRTMPHASRHPLADLRRSIEVSNTPQAGGGGPYSVFTHNTVVRLVQILGKDATYEKIGTHEEHEKGGYQVRVTYRATSKMGVADFDVYAFGQESTEGGNVRRQWHIEVQPSALEMVAKSFHSTEEGKAMIAATSSTKSLATRWLDSLATGRVEEAYLATLPPEKRPGQIEARLLDQKALISLTGLAIGGAIHASAADLRAFRDGMKAFRDGSVLDLTDLYPPAGPAKEQDRREIIARVKNFLEGGTGPDLRVSLAHADVPLYRRDGDTITASYPIQMMSREGNKGRIIEGDLEIVGPWSTTPLPSTRYRVARFRLLRGPEMPGRPGGRPS